VSRVVYLKPVFGTQEPITFEKSVFTRTYAMQIFFISII
jgi:hypothetical protein